jgi:hypothetical protein
MVEWRIFLVTFLHRLHPRLTLHLHNVTSSIFPTWRQWCAYDHKQTFTSCAHKKICQHVIPTILKQVESSTFEMHMAFHKITKLKHQVTFILGLFKHQYKPQQIKNWLQYTTSPSSMCWTKIHNHIPTFSKLLT